MKTAGQVGIQPAAMSVTEFGSLTVRADSKTPYSDATGAGRQGSDAGCAGRRAGSTGRTSFDEHFHDNY